MKEEKIENEAAELLNEEAAENQELNAEETVDETAEGTAETNEAAEPTTEELLAKAEERIAELEDKNLRMMAEFDNYRRRTNKEKLELMSTAGERIFKEMLPLVDDFERAIKSLPTPDPSLKGGENEHLESAAEGIKLIYQKFISFLDKQDVHAIETEDADFNTDEHEAITTFAAGEDKKGKVIDCTQKGYKLGDKVIRYAKVVVGD